MAKKNMIIVYATFPDIQSARKMAGSLINSRIAGCINMLPGMTSVYRWKGVVETAQETVMIVKTSAALRDEVIKAIELGHPYDTPAILSWDIAGGFTKYIDWIMSETRSP